MSFGKNLRNRRISMGWTQQQLADRMGKTKNNISQYELGKREPNCEQLLTFARLLGASTDQLLGRTALAEPTAGSAGVLAAPVLVPVFEGQSLKNPVDFRYLSPDECRRASMFYYTASDDSMADYRIEAGDCLLLESIEKPEKDGLYLAHMKDGRVMPRMVRRCPDGRYMLQASTRIAPEWVSGDAFYALGRLVRVEFSIDFNESVESTGQKAYNDPKHKIARGESDR